MKATERGETATLVHELATAMRRALTESPEVVARLRRIRNQGYEVSVMLEATISLARSDHDGASAAPRLDLRVENTEDEPLKMTPLDKKFLRSLKISVEEDD